MRSTTRTRHLISVDSRDRDLTKYPRPDDYRIDLPHAYHDVVRVVVIGAELPLSVLAFSAALGNTRMTVELPEPVVISIPDGNYTSASLVAALTSAFQRAGVTTVAVLYEEPSGRLTLARTDGGTLRLLLPPASPTSASARSLARMLGFLPGSRSSAPASPQPSIRADTAILLAADAYIMLHLAEGIDGLDECGHVTSWPAFAKLPLRRRTGVGASCCSVAYITGSDLPPPVNLGDHDKARLDRLHVRFRYHDGLPVDFNGADHSFVIEVQCASWEHSRQL